MDRLNPADSALESLELGIIATSNFEQAFSNLSR
jgi:hypothetical protein